jgi:peptidoglycan hydrolase-like amidase
LSGKGAQRRSKIWRKYNQIIKYYYQGVEVVDF